MLYIATLTIDELWQLLQEYQGKTFYTAKGLPFEYVIRGGEMFVSRKDKSITKASFAKALQRLAKNPTAITGPKALNVFGASYIFSLFKSLEQMDKGKGQK
ncbi:MAG: hypothetical protein IJ036_04445 [Lachnospiraceae bacterium]|nr:hypothetical protein [Lachnospiraceae bacterium]